MKKYLETSNSKPCAHIVRKSVLRCCVCVCVCFWCSCISPACASHLPHSAHIRFLNIWTNLSTSWIPLKPTKRLRWLAYLWETLKGPWSTKWNVNSDKHSEILGEQTSNSSIERVLKYVANSSIILWYCSTHSLAQRFLGVVECLLTCILLGHLKAFWVSSPGNSWTAWRQWMLKLCWLVLGEAWVGCVGLARVEEGGAVDGNGTTLNGLLRENWYHQDWSGGLDQ